MPFLGDMLVPWRVSNVMCFLSTEKRQSDALEMTSPQEIFNEILFCRVELPKSMTPNKATNLTTWVIKFNQEKNQTITSKPLAYHRLFLGWWGKKQTNPKHFPRMDG